MSVDMSSLAVTTRLRRVAQLRRLCLELGKAAPAASTERVAAPGTERPSDAARSPDGATLPNCRPR